MKIIQGIRRIENDKILKEIQDYIFEKNENSNKKISKVTKGVGGQAVLGRQVQTASPW